jgi:Tfp pilus assembly protein PilV
MMKVTNKGQSLIEVVFSIGLVALVVSGVMALLANNIGARTIAYDRLKAAELSNSVMEKLVSEKNANSAEFWNVASDFWNQNNGATQTDSSFSGYTYVIVPSVVSGNGCSNIVINCMNVVVEVGWSGSNNDDKYKLNRFFSRN